MVAIYKKELRGYFTSMVGYVFCAFLLVLIGVYFTAINIQSAYPNISAALNSVTFVFMIAVPVLTMKILAEEKKQRTDQILLTSPVKIHEIVMGKYLALLSVYLVPILIVCCYPLIMRMFGTVPIPANYTGIFGFFLLGCADIAIGVFISSITESQVIAAVITFLVLFVSFVMDGIASFFPQTSEAALAAGIMLILLLGLAAWSNIRNKLVIGVLTAVLEVALIIVYFIDSSWFESGIQRFLGIFNLSEHLQLFMTGIFDVTGLIYFLSVIFICIFMTVQNIEKRRWN